MVSLENFCNWVSMEQEVTENGFHMEDHTSTIITPRKEWRFDRQ